jgi:hypothetical protein
MNWRAESTGDPLRLSRPATQLAEIMAKVGNCSSTSHFRSLSEHRLGRAADRTIAELAALLPWNWKLA